MTFRIGQFLIVIGLILMVIFVGTDQARSPAYGFCCTGSLVLVLGAALMIKEHKEPGPSQRFRILRRGQENKENKPEKDIQP